MGTDGTTIYVVDDDQQMRVAIARLLRTRGFSVQSFGSAAELLQTKPVNGPGCLLLDLLMPGMNGLELQQHLNKDFATFPVIFVTGQGDIPATVQAMKAGALDFLTKPFEEEQLLKAIDAGVQKSRELIFSLRELERDKAAFNTLSRRERQVCLLVVQGMLNKQIGGELGTVEKTIKVQRSNVMRKLGVGSLADLVRLVERLRKAGLIGTEDLSPVA